MVVVVGVVVVVLLVVVVVVVVEVVAPITFQVTQPSRLRLPLLHLPRLPAAPRRLHLPRLAVQLAVQVLAANHWHHWQAGVVLVQAAVPQSGLRWCRTPT